MLKKYQNLGKSLSKTEMKMVKGGIIWPYLRVFGCTNGGGTNEGCTDWSSYGLSCCRTKYGPSSSAVWHEPYTSWSCPSEGCY